MAENVEHEDGSEGEGEPDRQSGMAAFEARFESMRADFQIAIKATNGFLAGLMLAEARRARDAGEFESAQALLNELAELIRISQAREKERIKKAHAVFATDYKRLERTARHEGGVVLQSVLGHLRSAKALADKMEFVEATQVLNQVRNTLEKGPNNITGKSRPFTINMET
ncbi:MAG: hypothetical protein JWR26_2831 [Pedosphaera sp.]|nr:hypothetical protein [Pedosphaera sp.]